MSSIWVLQLKPFGNGKQKTRHVLKIKGLQKLWTNKKRLSHLLMKKCVGNCILDSQPSLFLAEKNLLDLHTLSIAKFCKSMVNRSYHSQSVAFLLAKIVIKLELNYLHICIFAFFLKIILTLPIISISRQY